MSEAAITVIDTKKCFGGNIVRFRHLSEVTKVNMTCSVFLPNGLAKAIDDKSYPCIMYLSGLTCTDENVCQKSGVFRILSELGIGFIAPDTSPRNSGVPGESDSWDFGVGAGFYLDATESPWSENYRMYTYITQELLQVVSQNFTTLNISKMSIMGHSMGGHGALTIAIKNQHIFKSVSAFAPISNPMKCAWGKKAFTGYLGSNEETWKEYDSCELINKLGPTSYDTILIDVGSADNFLSVGQLLPENFQNVCINKQQNVTLRLQEGYDHSYYFISTFIEDHVRFHAVRLLA